ncbi:uncharacterized protein LOC118099177 [Hippoglossus stenolepis]|uniref:uncharacterized protein LOC118099177 n=1 Tax=Hippoglossus stenolepis TaxID=195615 RepID=UPI001FAE8312|nr:uncharacterized protein LOC118099177 [Hippoglossus stenolepis]
MDKTLLTLLLIVPLVSGGFHPTCSNLSLTVEEGEDVSLWCGLVPSVNLMSYTVEVTRTDLRQFVLLYRDRIVLHYVQMEQYRNRTTLDLKGLIRGNISVQISSVKMSDRGDYTCLIPRLKPRCIITLDVVEQRNHVSAAPPLENNSTSNQPGKGAVAAIVVPVVLCVLIPLGALLVVDFIRLRSGRNSLTGNCVTRCRGQKVKDPFTGYHAETGSGPVYIQDMVQPDEMRETGPYSLNRVGKPPPPSSISSSSSSPRTPAGPPPPPPPIRNGHSNFSSSKSIIDDFESKFNFHPIEDLPPPEEYRHFNKVYPKQRARVAVSVDPGMMRGAPPAPPVGR